MDISLNMIDLEYLTNPAFSKIKKIVKKDNHFEDTKFYRKRIFQLTRDLLCKKHINAELENAFNNYTRTCVDYFKFIDRSEQIQKDYEKCVSHKKSAPFLPETPPDYLMMRNVQPISRKITECIPIKYINAPPKPFMPKNRNINLKDEKYRSKGVIKKNIHNKYGKKKKKNAKKLSKKEFQTNATNKKA